MHLAQKLVLSAVLVVKGVLTAVLGGHIQRTSCFIELNHNPVFFTSAFATPESDIDLLRLQLLKHLLVFIIIVTVFVVLMRLLLLLMICLGHDFLYLQVRLIVIIIVKSLDGSHTLPVIIIVVVME